MKIPLFFIVVVLMTISCQNQETDRETSNSTENKTEITDVSFTSPENETLDNWVKYYQTNINPEFSLNRFKQTSIKNIQRSKGNVFGVFDDEFDEIYNDFLIYRSDGKSYIDIDSYLWNLDPEDVEMITYSVDQEINLVNISDRTVERFAFRGSMERVEDAFWENDSTLILLQNGEDQIPSITRINLVKEVELTYFYQDTLKKPSDYFIDRIKSKLR